MAQWVLASDGRPFRDRDAASVKRDLLSQDLGSAVQLEVVQHPAGGFAVACSRPGDAHTQNSLAPLDVLPTWMQADLLSGSSEPIPNAIGRTGPQVRQRSAEESPAHDISKSARSYPDVFRLSPAARAFLGQHVLALVGAYFLFRPHDFLLLVRVGVPANPQLAALGLGAVMLGAALLMMVSLSRFLWAYTANTYVIDGSGVEQVQWYFERGRLRRRAPRVNFAHLRTADVDQSVLQMLLDVGTLRLASGATDTYELDLRHVSAPRRLQAEFQRRLREATTSASAARRETEL